MVHGEPFGAHIRRIWFLLLWGRSPVGPGRCWQPNVQVAAG